VTWSRFVAIGDSFTEGLMDDVGPDGRHRGWADRTAEVLAVDNPGFTYANLAVRGRLMKQVMDEQVPAALTLAPDLVSVAAGVNDTLRRSYDLDASMTALENGVRALRGSGADVLVFAFGDPSRRSSVMSSVRDRIARANSATQAIAEHYGCMVVNFWGRAVFDDDVFWDGDRLHLSPAGHALASAAALQALGVGDERWRTPAPPSAIPPLPMRAVGHARWAKDHFGPWLMRRVQGRSSGDDVTPKRPTLGPMD
jgi:lysophospholipase L1-like esterase